MKKMIRDGMIFGVIAATVHLAGPAARAQDSAPGTVTLIKQTAEGGADPSPQVHVEVKTDGKSDDADPTTTFSSSGPGHIVIQSIEPDGQREPGRKITWLGLAVGEAPEVLSAQLGLKPGEGLTVNFLAPDSPAAKANFQKNDVLVELDGQMLVDAEQLRKLVQMHAEGDTIKLTYYRAGHKETADVKLGKRTADEESDRETGMTEGFGMSEGGMPRLKMRLERLNGQMHGLNGQIDGPDDSLARAGLDKAEMNRQLQQTLEQTRKAIQDSVQRATELRSLTNLDRELEDLARNGVDVDRDATVIVRSKHNSNRTIVKTDDDGSIVMVEGEKEHLTARDKDGNLLFDGDIDTAAEKAKVPPAVWEKVKPMLK